MNELEKIVKQSLRELDKIEISPFSAKGFTQFKNQISDFIYNLYYESHKISKLNQSDLISSEHVEFASSKIVKARRFKRTSFLTTLAGLLLGSALSNIFSMTSYDVQFSTTGIVLTVLCGIFGAFLLGYSLWAD